MSGAAWAQGSPLTFDQIVELAHQQSPVVDAQEASPRVSHALISKAGASPNPVHQLQSQADGLERLSSIGLAISKPLELGHKRAARIRAAELSLMEAESNRVGNLVERRFGEKRPAPASEFTPRSQVKGAEL